MVFIINSGLIFSVTLSPCGHWRKIDKKIGCPQEGKEHPE